MLIADWLQKAVLIIWGAGAKAINLVDYSIETIILLTFYPFISVTYNFARKAISLFYRPVAYITESIIGGLIVWTMMLALPGALNMLLKSVDDVAESTMEYLYLGWFYRGLKYVAGQNRSYKDLFKITNGVQQNNSEYLEPPSTGESNKNYLDRFIVWLRNLFWNPNLPQGARKTGIVITFIVGSFANNFSPWKEWSRALTATVSNVIGLVDDLTLKPLASNMYYHYSKSGYKGVLLYIASAMASVFTFVFLIPEFYNNIIKGVIDFSEWWRIFKDLIYSFFQEDLVLVVENFLHMTNYTLETIGVGKYVNGTALTNFAIALNIWVAKFYGKITDPIYEGMKQSDYRVTLRGWRSELNKAEIYRKTEANFLRGYEKIEGKVWGGVNAINNYANKGYAKIDEFVDKTSSTIDSGFKKARKIMYVDGAGDNDTSGDEKEPRKRKEKEPEEKNEKEAEISKKLDGIIDRIYIAFNRMSIMKLLKGSDDWSYGIDNVPVEVLQRHAKNPLKYFRETYPTVMHENLGLGDPAILRDEFARRVTSSYSEESLRESFRLVDKSNLLREFSKKNIVEKAWALITFIPLLIYDRVLNITDEEPVLAVILASLIGITLVSTAWWFLIDRSKQSGFTRKKMTEIADTFQILTQIYIEVKDIRDPEINHGRLLTLTRDIKPLSDAIKKRKTKLNFIKDFIDYCLEFSMFLLTNELPEDGEVDIYIRTTLPNMINEILEWFVNFKQSGVLRYHIEKRRDNAVGVTERLARLNNMMLKRDELITADQWIYDDKSYFEDEMKKKIRIQTLRKAADKQLEKSINDTLKKTQYWYYDEAIENAIQQNVYEEGNVEDIVQHTIAEAMHYDDESEERDFWEEAAKVEKNNKRRRR